MKKWPIILLTTLIIGAGLSACNKFLDVNPNDRFTGADYWKTPEDAQMGVTAAYSILRNRYASCIQYAFGDLRPGNFNMFKKSNFAALAANDLRGGGLTTTDGSNRPRENWTDWWESIATANLCIARIDEMKSSQISPAEKARLMGEARFVRCFNYYMLVLQYGDVPLQLDPYDIALKPRMDMLRVFDTCISDLRIAAADLPVTYNDPTHRAVRATRGAALTLMAHMYMWQAGFDAANAQALYRKAADACKEAMDLNIYRLMPYEPELFKEIFKGRSEEGIWEISMDANYGNIMNNFISQWVLHQPVLASSGSLYGGLGSEITVKKEYLDYLYTPGEPDARFTLWFDDPYSTVNPQSQMFLKFSSIPDPAVRSFDANIIIFRYADLLLLRAEALSYLGTEDATAIALLNEVRRRAEAEDYTGAGGKPLQDAIFRERVKELWCEGHRWYDLVRTGRVKDFTQCENFLSDDQFERGAWTWPIPNSAIRSNPLITQNPYWAQ